ncbi:hypothetical protein ACP4OV_013376 [Aristida adscensionis]
MDERWKDYQYMEYWTRESLSDMFTQADMTKFRTKLAAILVTCQQNNVDECPSVKKKCRVEFESPDDVVCFGIAFDLFNTPQSIIGNEELHDREQTEDESVNKQVKSCHGLNTVGRELCYDVSMTTKNLDEQLENTEMEDNEIPTEAKNLKRSLPGKGKEAL